MQDFNLLSKKNAGKKEKIRIRIDKFGITWEAKPIHSDHFRLWIPFAEMTKGTILSKILRHQNIGFEAGKFSIAGRIGSIPPISNRMNRDGSRFRPRMYFFKSKAG